MFATNQGKSYFSFKRCIIPSSTVNASIWLQNNRPTGQLHLLAGAGKKESFEVLNIK